MPTPIGHALAGLAVAGIASGPSHLLKRPGIGVLVGCAVAPDLDLLLGFLDGASPHRGPSHSFTAAVIAGLLGRVLGRRLRGVPDGRWIGVAWASHVALDYFGLDTSAPIGEMALWPFSTGFFASPVSVFYDVPRSFSGWAIRHNAVAAAIEIVVLAPVALICWRRFAARGARP